MLRMEPITPYGLSIGGFALDSSTEISSSPRVWLLVGEKRGDNAQVENLARAIGWAYEEKKIIVAHNKGMAIRINLIWLKRSAR